MKKIIKVLNSSVVLVSDESHEEFIVMGKGIGYGKKKGDNIESTDADQTFIPLKAEQQELFEEFSKISPEIIEMSEAIISYAEILLKTKLNSSIHYALADHINFAVERYKNNILISNRMLYEVKTFYNEEYSVGLYGINLLKDRMKTDLPEDEAANIAFHIVNANDMVIKTSDSMHNVRLIREITDIVQYSLNKSIDKESMNYARFVTHIKFFVIRILNASMLDDNLSLYDSIQKEYPDCIKIADKIASYLFTKYGYTITNDEKVFLAVHINRL